MLPILAPSTRGSLSIGSSIPANLIKKPSVCTSIRVLSTPASSTPPSKALAGRSNCATPPNTASQAIDVHPPPEGYLKGGGLQTNLHPPFFAFCSPRPASLSHLDSGFNIQ